MRGVLVFYITDIPFVFLSLQLLLFLLSKWDSMHHHVHILKGKASQESRGERGRLHTYVFGCDGGGVPGGELGERFALMKCHHHYIVS